jgi:hypothetical protein
VSPSRSDKAESRNKLAERVLLASLLEPPAAAFALASALGIALAVAILLLAMG